MLNVGLSQCRQQKWEISNAEGDVTKAAIEECKTVQEKLIDELRVR